MRMYALPASRSASLQNPHDRRIKATLAICLRDRQGNGDRTRLVLRSRGRLSSQRQAASRAPDRVAYYAPRRWRSLTQSPFIRLRGTCRCA